MANYPNTGIDENLITKGILSEIMETKVFSVSLGALIGKSNSSLVKETTPSASATGEGLTLKIPRSGPIDPMNFVGMYEQVRGTGTEIAVDYDEITMAYRKQEAVLRGVPIKPLEFVGDLRTQTVTDLSEAAADRMNILTWDAIAKDPFSNNIRPSWDRCLFEGGAADDFVKFATFKTKTFEQLKTAYAAVDVDDGYPTVDSIYKLGDILRRGGKTAGSEAMIKPAVFTTINGFIERGYFLLMDTEAFQRLRIDEQWRAFEQMALADINRPNPLVGLDYKGKINGIHIYSCGELDRRRIDLGNNKQMAVNVLMGSRALDLYMSDKKKLINEYDEAEGFLKWFFHELYGFKATRYPSLSGDTVRSHTGIFFYFTRLGA